MKILSTPLTRSEKPDSSYATETFPTAERFAMFFGLAIPFVGLIAAIFVFWGHGVGILELALMLGMYCLTVIGVTVGYHRLFTHRSFKTSAPIRFILGMLGSMSLQGPLIQWSAIHRRHHQDSDREGDPHSPHEFGGGIVGLIKGFWHAHMGWLFNADPVDMDRSVSDLIDDRAARLADKFFWYFVVLGLVIPAAIGGAVHHSWAGAASAFLWGGLVRICIMHHATFSINSACHIWGTQPYRNSDQSRNNWIFGIVSFGEGWHNNHHAFPTSARHGLKWWQLDISWLFIQTLCMLRLASEPRVPSVGAMRIKAREISHLRSQMPIETVASLSAGDAA